MNQTTAPIHHILSEVQHPARVYFVRHGESEGNLRGEIQGTRDLPLTSRGVRQAEDTARWFASLELPVAAVVTSPLQRARSTAQTIAAAVHGTPVVQEALRELHAGIFTGMDFATVRKTFPREYAEFARGSWDAVPEAETGGELAARALVCWQQVVELTNSTPGAPGAPAAIIVVTHGGFLQWILKTSFGADPASPPGWMPLIRASNCGIFQYDIRPAPRWYYGQWSLMDHVVHTHNNIPPGGDTGELFHTDTPKSTREG